jgi:DNA topoisomerase-1
MKKGKLLIVESPTKARTLDRYLKGTGFTVISSNGHIIDLPKSKLSVDIKNNFKPTYDTIKGKSRIVSMIKKAAKDSSEIYLATDPDREGEAIAYHITQIIQKKIVPHRILFHEITKESIKESLKKPGYVNMYLVKSQQARRILDRLVGYKISPYLWKTIKRGLSAGRVQTVALRLIVERENAIDSFIREEYWTIDAHFKKTDDGEFKASLMKIDGEKAVIKTEKECDAIIDAIKSEQYTVTKFEKKNVEKVPPPPFITSNLQLEASKRFNFSAKRTMTIAQQLYEGIDLGEEGPVGLITYMRTDSFRVSNKSQEDAKRYIQDSFGEKFLPPSKRVYRSHKGAQEAHEAIRPTSSFRTPDKIKKYLNSNQLKLYSLIWERFIASQMANGVFESTSADIKGGKYLFRANSKKVLFKGFLILQRKEDEKPRFIIPPLSEGERVHILTTEKSQHFTEPPKRYSEGTLVKQLEAKGIGRPSTYAPIISTIQDRGYVIKQEKVLVPTDLGKVVLKILLEYFEEIFNYDFTKEMEEELDEIEEGKKDMLLVLNDFYKPLSRMLDKVEKEVTKIKKKIEKKTDVKCELCGKPMTIKWGKYGKFLACSGYPDCEYTKQINEEKIEGSCPQCGSSLIIRRGKYGRFVSCENYPKCNFTASVSTGVPCPEKNCDGELVEKQTKKGKVFYGCSKYPECTYALWNKPVSRKCSQCSFPLLVEKYGRSGVYLQCPECKSKFSEDGVKLKKK